MLFLPLDDMNDRSIAYVCFHISCVYAFYASSQYHAEAYRYTRTHVHEPHPVIVPDQYVQTTESVDT